ncbi:hypothetical protein EBB07_03380 [Paenibacillaceae bacterium]|nr:hypothetical protein EBB07_03380 [Paenibacillaceae bacterium]
MKKITKLIVVPLLAAGIAIMPLETGPAALVSAASTSVQNQIQVLVDGQKLTLDPSPVQVNGTTLVPMRAIFKALSADVVWEQQSKTIIARKGSTTISLKVGSKQAIVNGKTFKLAEPAQVKQGATLVPLRLVSEALGAKVEWNAQQRTIKITSFESLVAGIEDGSQHEEEGYYTTYTAADIVALNDDKVVMIDTNRSQGSGIIIGERLILTNYHVMTKATEGKITLSDGKTIKVEGVVASDENADLAIIQTSGKLNIEPVIISDSSLLRKGDRVFAIGSPLGFYNTVSEGLVSNVHMEDDVLYLQINAPIDHGSSGGALFDEYGHLVGITTSTIERSGANLNFAVSSLHVADLLNQLEKNQYAVPAFLKSDLPDSLSSASLTEISDAMKKHFGKIWTKEGTTELKDWTVTRDSQGWLVISANMDPAFYMFYADSTTENMRDWALNAISELKRMLPDQRVELSVYYDQTFNYEPRGFAEGETSSLGDGKWKVRYPVIHAQVQDRAHVTVRSN